MLIHSQQIGQLLCARVVQGFTRRCISNASAKLSTSFLARSGFQNPFSIFLHYSLKFSVFLCFSLFMAQKKHQNRIDSDAYISATNCLAAYLL